MKLKTMALTMALVLSGGSGTVAAVFSLAMAGPGASGTMAQSHDSHDHGMAAAEHAGHGEHGQANEAAASESDWLNMPVDDPRAHAGHDDITPMQAMASMTQLPVRANAAMSIIPAIVTIPNISTRRGPLCRTPGMIKPISLP